jgi:hypothetical protein
MTSKLVSFKRCSDSEWAAPTFIIPEINGTLRLVSDFRKLDEQLKRKPYPITKMSCLSHVGRQTTVNAQQKVRNVLSGLAIRRRTITFRCSKINHNHITFKPFKGTCRYCLAGPEIVYAMLMPLSTRMAMAMAMTQIRQQIHAQV